MNTKRIDKAIKGIIFSPALLVLLVGCTAQEDRTIGMNHWRWIEIIVSLAVGFLIGILVSNWKNK